MRKPVKGFALFEPRKALQDKRRGKRVAVDDIQSVAFLDGEILSTLAMSCANADTDRAETKTIAENIFNMQYF